MSYDSDLEEERRGILSWLRDVAFGRRDDHDNQAGGKYIALGLSIVFCRETTIRHGGHLSWRLLL